MKNLTETNEIIKGIECGFTYCFMSSLDLCEDFIWGYLYDSGLQHLAPIETSQGFLLIHEK
jgi:hypothetical protein